MKTVWEGHAGFQGGQILQELRGRDGPQSLGHGDRSRTNQGLRETEGSRGPGLEPCSLLPAGSLQSASLRGATLTQSGPEDRMRGAFCLRVLLFLLLLGEWGQGLGCRPQRPRLPGGLLPREHSRASQSWLQGFGFSRSLTLGSPGPAVPLCGRGHLTVLWGGWAKPCKPLHKSLAPGQCDKFASPSFLISDPLFPRPVI